MPLLCSNQAEVQSCTVRKSKSNNVPAGSKFSEKRLDSLRKQWYAPSAATCDRRIQCEQRHSFSLRGKRAAWVARFAVAIRATSLAPVPIMVTFEHFAVEAAVFASASGGGVCLPRRGHRVSARHSKIEWDSGAHPGRRHRIKIVGLHTDTQAAFTSFRYIVKREGKTAKFNYIINLQSMKKYFLSSDAIYRLASCTPLLPSLFPSVQLRIQLNILPAPGPAGNYAPALRPLCNWTLFAYLLAGCLILILSNFNIIQSRIKRLSLACLRQALEVLNHILFQEFSRFLKVF